MHAPKEVPPVVNLHHRAPGLVHNTRHKLRRADTHDTRHAPQPAKGTPLAGVCVWHAAHTPGAAIGGGGVLHCARSIWS